MKILAFTGSMRAASLNRRLLLVACDRLKERGADVTEIELRNLDIPMFGLDLESDIKAGKTPMPSGIKILRELMVASDAFVIASPEHNGAMTAALKNAIDWASRYVDDTGPLACFRGKVCGLLSASPGRLGGIRGLPDVRRVLSSIGTLVVPADFALHAAHDALGGESEDDGSRDEQAIKGAHRVADAVYDVTQALLAAR
ncbi:MAG: NAD(P)H-dependent oxidoreductase [Phycisphaerales bacterium]